MMVWSTECSVSRGGCGDGDAARPQIARAARSAPISGRAWPFVMSFEVGLLVLQELRQWLVWGAQDWKSSVLAAGPPGYGQNSILNEEVQGFLLGHRILQGLPYELDPILTAR